MHLRAEDVGTSRFSGASCRGRPPASPGGQLALLEFDLPTRPWLRAPILAYLWLPPDALRPVCPEAAGHRALAGYANTGTNWLALWTALQAACLVVRQQRLPPAGSGPEREVERQ